MIEPHRLGKKTDPGRTARRSAARPRCRSRWIAQMQPFAATCRRSSGLGTPVFKRFRHWVEPMFSNGCSTPSQTIPTWNTPWLTQRSSRSTGTARARRGIVKPTIGKSKDGSTMKSSLYPDALGNHRCERLAHASGSSSLDTVGVSAAHRRHPFGGLIADEAFDSIGSSKPSTSTARNRRLRAPTALRNRSISTRDNYKWRHLIENFLLQTQRVRAHHDAQ